MAKVSAQEEVEILCVVLVSEAGSVTSDTTFVNRTEAFNVMNYKLSTVTFLYGLCTFVGMHHITCTKGQCTPIICLVRGMSCHVTWCHGSTKLLSRHLCSIWRMCTWQACVPMHLESDQDTTQPSHITNESWIPACTGIKQLSLAIVLMVLSYER